ncbi:MAG: hypothetical protein ACI8ZM_000168 [Crocinitomix sp.]|jgi:hypothetical protein
MIEKAQDSSAFIIIGHLSEKYLEPFIDTVVTIHAEIKEDDWDIYADDP